MIYVCLDCRPSRASTHTAAADLLRRGFSRHNPGLAMNCFQCALINRTIKNPLKQI